ncbi:hypothetical protein LOTGIDRAFT_176362 [Lottia gigantea]|uniref:Uncharacterized protein n=1 Tax=Lottia gigantea TaxID=225164 RepID=V4BEC8_LOTGI|nr:hypothetical protein LOTGIDRAFT_176362 [Lottia gigantea]ESP04142.1 hypothetical protein LOTGIDRAFT_176362 [Lottia gigantea]
MVAKGTVGILIVLFNTICANIDLNYNQVPVANPLLFGRRGINPDMSSLFFGKRSGNSDHRDLRKMKDTCKAVLSSCKILFSDYEDDTVRNKVQDGFGRFK